MMEMVSKTEQPFLRHVNVGLSYFEAEASKITSN